jgi:uncharacterized ferredoxin-like protein
VHAVDPIPSNRQVPASIVNVIAAPANNAMHMPTDVAIDSHGRIYVADGANDRIVWFEPNGRFAAAISAVNGEKLSRPVGIFIDAKDQLWIADSGNHRILAVKPAGVPEIVTPPPTEKGAPCDPTDLVVSADGAASPAPRHPVRCELAQGNVVLGNGLVELALGESGPLLQRWTAAGQPVVEPGSLDLVITGSDLKKVSAEMRRIAQENDVAFFARDAGNVDASQAIVVLGQKTVQLNIPVCGYCGFDSCADNARAGAACAIGAGDLGIAACSAAAVAGLHHIDNRIMFSIGRAVLNLRLFNDEKVTMAYGIPLSVTGIQPRQGGRRSPRT